MARAAAEPSVQPFTRLPVERVLAILASCVAAAEALIVFITDAPAQHRWLSLVLIAGLAHAASGWRVEQTRRIARLALLSGAAVATRATIRLDQDLSPMLAALDAAALVGMVVVAVLTLVTLARATGIGTALLAGFAGAAILTCVALVLERSPGARLGMGSTTVRKGPWPHRTYGLWYPPGSRVRAFFASDPRKYFDPPASLPRQWRLNIHTARDRAELRFDPAALTTFRVEIGHSEPGDAWAIQLNQGPIVVHASRPYELKFRARADSAREITVAVSEWHPPWQGLGFTRRIAVTPEWMPWVEQFTLLRDDTNARLHFDVGNHPASVELSDVVLTDLTTGEALSPDPTPYSLTHQLTDAGCRGRALHDQPPSDVRRILVLGDAYAFGPAVRDRDLLGTRLAGLLERDGADANVPRRRVEVLTCAVPGWGARQERLFYEDLRRHYAAELVIVVTSWNDGRLQRDDGAPPAEDNGAADGIEQIARELRQLAARVQADGGRPVVVVFRNTPSMIWERTLAALAPLVADGVPVFDLWPSLVAQGRWEALVDPSPLQLPNEVAHGVAADAIADFLRARGLLP